MQMQQTKPFFSWISEKIQSVANNNTSESKSWERIDTMPGSLKLPAESHTEEATATAQKQGVSCVHICGIRSMRASSTFWKVWLILGEIHTLSSKGCFLYFSFLCILVSFFVYFGQFSVYFGQFSVYSGQFSVYFDQFSVYSGQFSVYFGQFYVHFSWF